MLRIEALRQRDSKGMHKIYDLWPQIAKESYEANLEPFERSSINHIVFAGMGGSGALGDIFSAILSKTNIHVDIVKGYHLPRTVSPDSLIVTISVSGNTKETLTVLDSSKKYTRNVISFSSGGIMENYCFEKNIEFRKIPLRHSPRASFTSFLYSMLKVLGPILPTKKESIFESISSLEMLSKKISSNNLSESNSSLNLAQWITGLPVVYYPWGLQAAAIRFKNSLSENSKINAITEDIIEACHNGIVSWEKKSNMQPILLQGDEDYYRTKERWKIIKEFFEEKKIDYKEIHSIRGNILSKLINMIYLLDYASIYKAILNETDPTPIEPIDFVKERL